MLPPRPSDGAPWLRSAWPLAIAVAIAGAVFAVHLRNGWVWDDAATIVADPAVTGAAPWRAALDRDLFYFLTGTQELHVPHYRPAFTAAERLLWAAGGGATWPFHLASLALHLLAGTLGLAVLSRAGVPRGAAIAAAALFLVDPVSAEPVYWACSLADPLLLVGLLVSLLCASRAREARGSARAALLAGSAAGSALAVFSKEPGLVVPVLVAVEALAAPRREWRTRLWAAAPAWAPIPVYLALCAALLPASRVLAFDALPRRLGRALEILAWDLSRLVFPFPVSPIHELRFGVPLAAAVLALGAVALAAVARRLPGGVLLAAWIVLPLLPALAQPFVAGDTGLPVADRYVYPSLLPALAALATAAAALGRRLLRDPAPALVGAAALAFAGAAAVTGWAGRAYASDAALYARVLDVYPRQPHALLWIGGAALDRGDVAAALPTLEAAVAADPKVSVARLRLGDALRKADRLDEALAAYAAAILLEPTLVQPRLPRSDLLAELGHADAALAELQAAAALEPANGEVRLRLGALRMAAGDAAGAIAEWQAGLAGRPGPATCALLLNVATGHVRLGRDDAARDAGRRFVASCPGPEFAEVRAQLADWLAGR